MLKKQLAKFNHIMQGIEKIYEDYAKSVGLTYMSLTVLEIIYYSETPCTKKEICEQSHYNKQMVNTIVKSFYDKGYLMLTEVEADRRNKHISLSESGRNYADVIMNPLWKIEKQALSVLSDKERETLLEMLGRCYEGFRTASE